MIHDLTNYYAPRLGNCHETRSTDHWQYPPHRHIGTSDFIICLAGTMKNTVNGTSVTLEPGQLLWVHDGDIHSIEAENVHFFNIDVPPSVVFMLADGLGGRDLYQAHKSTSDRRAIDIGDFLEIIVWKIQQFSEKQYEDNAPLYLRSLVTDLLTVCLINTHNTANHVLPWLEDICSHIENNLHNISSGDLSEVTGYSPSHISRSFKQAFDQTPSQYINQRRIDRAANRLAASNDDISGICYDLGFGSLSYFYRLFHQYKQMTPRKYRQQHNLYYR